MRSRAFLAIVLGAVAALGAQLLCYGLVYPARSQGKWPILLSLLAGGLLASIAAWLSARAHGNATGKSERFLALLGVVLSAFFLFVVLVGYGIPNLFLGPRD